MMKINKLHTRKSMPDSFKNGFTLAETLVTMAIIGVLAAIMIPTMISLKPNKEMVMLKKAYEMTSRVINELINDEELYENDELGFYDDCKVTYHRKEYGENDNSCNTGIPTTEDNSSSAAKKFCNLFAARMNLSGTATCNAGGGGSFITSDGMQWTMPNTISSNPGTNSTITVNVTPDRKDASCADGANSCNEPNIFNIQFNRFGRITIAPHSETQKSAAQLYLSSNKTTKTLAELRELDKK